MIGIIILNYKSATDCITCISSIEKKTAVSYKIYIVDGCSPDDSYKVLSQYFETKRNVELLKSDINGGYSYGNNLGIKKAIADGADAILIVNPDIILENNAIDLMYHELIQSPDLAVTGPRILSKEGRDMQFASRLYTLTSFLCSKKPIAYIKNRRIYENRYYEYSYKADFVFQGMVSGCCFMIKAQDFKSIGLFDTNIFLYYEEDILAYKLFQINKLTKIVSAALVEHNHSNTVKKEGEAFVRFHRFYSSQYVLKEYAGISKLQFVIISIIHVSPFAINALLYKPYRKIFNIFIKKISSLYKQY